MEKMTEENNLYFPLRKDVKGEVRIGIIILVIMFSGSISGLQFYKDYNLLLKIVISILSIPISFLFVFFFLTWILPHHEAIITVTNITEKKYWRKRTILWQDVTRIVENPVDPFLLGARSAMGKYFFGIQSRKKTIKFTDYIDQYEKFKEIVFERAVAKEFKHKTYNSFKGVAQEWIKEER